MVQSTDAFPVLLIGGGFAMFGTPEGPWNISARLEQKLGDRLRVEAVIEVDPPRAEAALALKRESDAKNAYADTVIIETVEEFKARVDKGELKQPRAIFIATPPKFRGGTTSGRDIELQVHKHFPSVAIFLEKPVATGTPYQKSIDEAKEVGKLLADEHKAPIAIGYLSAVQEMKKIIDENNLTV